MRYLAMRRPSRVWNGSRPVIPVIASAADFRPDLVIALAQAPLNASVCDRLRAAGIKVAFWFVENYRVLPYWKQVAEAILFTIGK